MAALETLEGLVLESILSKLGPRSVAVVACVSNRLRSFAADETLWRAFCSQDLDLSGPVDPDGNRLAYQIWRESFIKYPWQLVMRTKRCWSNMKDWMAGNFAEAHGTLQKGASESEIEEVEKNLGVKLPLPTRLLYRFCNGQDTMNGDVSVRERVSLLGAIGGYCFYDHLVNVHLLPLTKILEETRQCRRQLGFSARSKLIVVAVSYFLFVGTKNLTDGEMLPCVPQASIRPAPGDSNGVLQDAMLLWLEEHTRCLQSGLFQLREFHKRKMICLFPEAPPSCTVAITNGVKVRASSILVPELCDLNDEGGDKYWFAYSIRLSLSPEGCMLDGVLHNSCQLYSRHWIIRAQENVVSDVRGEAVIGKFPLLFPDEEEFVYESCASLPRTPGSIEGSFTFVPGRLTDQKGRQFEVEVARFSLQVPSYIF
ncbi:unnamed protein product [Spirodela intermedia]|uniref:ApaG domain-containing protein n=1 Tax=Spirodela intermedia TaxID=51605 RepID=A0A7I8IQU5_SPIIN|nr:unnamed protein product [Spirodela intermedia]CAA6660310.1 unnamed protein product [Spirodela intermedia]